MAALDTPWLSHMSTPRSQRSDTLDSSSSFFGPSSPSSQRNNPYATDGAPVSTPSGLPHITYAAFSPATLSTAAPGTTSAAKRRSTILVHQKSPLLLATPPQITRALAYSHPFLLPLNKLAGLLSWTTGDPWESFMVVASFWAIVLYGDVVVRLTGPVVLVLILIGGMYGRRFSPLSSSGWSEPGLGASDGTPLGSEGKERKAKKPTKNKNLAVDGLPDAKNGKANGGGGGTPGGHQRNQGSISEITNTRHQKTLDEIVETLKEFTARCNILLEPLLELTDFLSTQRTPTSATTRPALTTLFVRILLCTPFWFALTLPPLRIITTRRVVLVFGTLCLTWHARVMRVARGILWRSASVRSLLALVTGLEFEGPMVASAIAGLSQETSATSSLATGSGKDVATPANGPRESELTKALRRARGGNDAGVRFSFIIYENQRRWVGLGWTTSLFAYERSAWTDEHNTAVPPRDQFELPDVEDGNHMRWQWVEGSRWRVDGVPDEAVRSEDMEKNFDYDGPGGRMGWVYYDNKWQSGRRGLDGWGRWTRRRKWYRDAELVETEPPSQAATVDGPENGEENSSHVSTPPPPLPSRPEEPVSTSGAASRSAPVPIPNEEAKDTKKGSSGDKDKEREEDYDSASVLSSSSMSNRFKSPSLRRRVTDSSHRSRRTSGAASEEDVASSLGTTVNLAIHDAAREGESLGFGDEVRMGLE